LKSMSMAAHAQVGLLHAMLLDGYTAKMRNAANLR
jgi:hypothetical protein